MREYIKNLTDNLIGKNRYDEVDLKMRGQQGYPGNLVDHVKVDLEAGDIQDMNPETLGKIMANLEIGDVMASRKELFDNLHFSGNCEDLLRELVALCLAFVVRDRLDPSQRLIPTYRNSSPQRDTVRGGNILVIDRAKVFDPTKFPGLGRGWSIKEEDERSLALKEVDVSRIQLISTFKEGEEYLSGRDQLKWAFKAHHAVNGGFTGSEMPDTLKEGEDYLSGESILKRLALINCTRLDIQVFYAFWKNQTMIPEQWKQEVHGHTTYVHFAGTVLQSPDGVRFGISLLWTGKNWWWNKRELKRSYNFNNPAAVLLND